MFRKIAFDVDTPADMRAEDDARSALYLKVALRLMPLLMVCYVVAYLDRINVGFAKLQMQEALGFSDAVYGLGAGIFFIGYFLFEVPSNLLLQRIGARKTITRIMVLWGITGCAMATVSSPAAFYVLRFLLGVFEAGFFPGVVYYLGLWFPRQRRGQILGVFMTGFPIAGMIGGPVSGWAMSHLGGLANLAGWQWLYIVEAAPAVLLGIVTWFTLSDGIEGAKWLSGSERESLRQALRNEGESIETVHAGGLRQVIGDPKVYLMSFAYFTFICGTYALSFWLPTVLKSAGATSVEHIGWLSALPYGIAAIGMVLICRSSDRLLERRWHGALAAFVGAVALSLLPLLQRDLIVTMALLSIASTTIFVTLPLIWSLASDYFAGSPAAAGAIGFVNSLGLLGGFFSPFAMGWLKALSGTLSSGLYLMTTLLALGACAILCVRIEGAAEQ
ncbi:MFS transporter (plasmid) [Paraburkholderia graminis]|uniref:MFS transporter n=1 Tax=Paraburkholderia graminis TaxID=60548 RepID=UPI000DEF9648|nr:MFS transporter [Paraburkholderia graminis]AXF12712.1 MFS transporter [Paraburkholderia graminis]